MKDYTEKLSQALDLLKATKVNFNEGSKGWNFAVYWGGRPYPNFVSSLVKTNIGAVRNFLKYAERAEFSLYGNAE